MKTIFVFIAFTLLAYTPCAAQTNSEEAQLTYKLAIEAYNKGDYSTCSTYLNDVIRLDSNSKAKVSYQQVKCIEPFLFYDNYDDSKFSNALNWIKQYLSVGADENKRNELMTLKIKIEHDPGYKLCKEIEGYSREQLNGKIIESLNFKTLADYMKLSAKGNDNQKIIYDTAFFKNEHTLLVAWCTDNWTSGAGVSPGILIFEMYLIDFKKEECYNLGILRGQYFRTFYSEREKKEVKKFEKWHRADVMNYPNMTADHFARTPDIRENSAFPEFWFFNKDDKEGPKLLDHYFVRMKQLCK